jgi:hypothetical protein
MSYSLTCIKLCLDFRQQQPVQLPLGFRHQPLRAAASLCLLNARLQG